MSRATGHSGDATNIYRSHLGEINCQERTTRRETDVPGPFPVVGVMDPDLWIFARIWFRSLMRIKDVVRCPSGYILCTAAGMIWIRI